MKKLVVLIFGTVSFSVFAQKSYDITGFSEKYKGKITIEKGYEDEVFKKGSISIIDTKTEEQIIKIDAEELILNLDESTKVKTKGIELPYETQGVIICQDFNFDGKNDLAIMDGQFSCYHGPSFQIYLETENGLNHSPEFTRLSQEYCGMFAVDYEIQKIYTMIKSGCCWHQYSEFTVESDIPVEDKIVEEGLNANGVLWDFTEKQRLGNQMVEKSYSLLVDDADIILVHALKFKNGKTMEIYRAIAYGDYLFYIYKDKDNKIELFYSDEFTYDSKKNILTFTENETKYNIYTSGMLINMPGRKVELNAISTDSETNLSSFKNLKLRNLNVK